MTRWLKKRFQSKEDIAVRKPKIKKVFQTQDKRTVKRRLAKLKESSAELDISEWIQQTEANLPKLFPSVGSKRIPRTTNAIEHFSSPSFSSQSATRHLTGSTRCGLASARHKKFQKKLDKKTRFMYNHSVNSDFSENSKDCYLGYNINSGYGQ